MDCIAIPGLAFCCYVVVVTVPPSPIKVLQLFFNNTTTRNWGAQKCMVKPKLDGEHEDDAQEDQYSGSSANVVQEMLLNHGDLMTMEGMFKNKSSIPSGLARIAKSSWTVPFDTRRMTQLDLKDDCPTFRWL
jgi:hypothetical protein